MKLLPAELLIQVVLECLLRCAPHVAHTAVRKLLCLRLAVLAAGGAGEGAEVAQDVAPDSPVRVLPRRG